MTVENLTEQWTKSEKASEDSYASTKQFHQVPGPTGFPVIGTLLDYFKKDGLKFSKMFEVCQLFSCIIIILNARSRVLMFV